MKTRPHWLLPSSSVALIGYTHSSDLLSLPLSLSLLLESVPTQLLPNGVSSPCSLGFQAASGTLLSVLFSLASSYGWVAGSYQHLHSFFTLCLYSLPFSVCGFGFC